MADERIKLWRHKATGDLFEVRITDEYQTARRVPANGLYTDADHKLGAEIVAHADEYEEVPLREIDRDALG